MSIRIGVNGIGRIGRNLWRIIHTSAPDVEIVAINDIAGAETVGHLLRYGSIRGPFPGEVVTTADAIVVDGRAVPLTRHSRPEQIPWREYGVDLVLESTGQFTRDRAAAGHLRAGAPRVIISTASPDADVSLMMGVNETAFDPRRHRIVSNSCCTTYCLGTILHALDHVYGVVSATATVAYAYGGRPGQLLDGVFPNLRMARANPITIAPVNVPGVRHALNRVLPELAGRVAATAIRVPAEATSAASMVLRLSHPASAAEVNQTLEVASATVLKESLGVSHEPLVSTDVLGRPYAALVDAGLTMSLGDLVRVVGWYDNEWGYAHRLLELIRFIAHQV